MVILVEFLGLSEVNHLLAFSRGAKLLPLAHKRLHVLFSYCLLFPGPKGHALRALWRQRIPPGLHHLICPDVVKTNDASISFLQMYYGGVAANDRGRVEKTGDENVDFEILDDDSVSHVNHER